MRGCHGVAHREEESWCFVGNGVWNKFNLRNTRNLKHLQCLPLSFLLFLAEIVFTKNMISYYEIIINCNNRYVVPHTVMFSEGQNIFLIDFISMSACVKIHIIIRGAFSMCERIKCIKCAIWVWREAWLSFQGINKEVKIFINSRIYFSLTLELCY